MVRKQKGRKGGSAGRDAYSVGDVTLGQVQGTWVAYFRENGARKRTRLGHIDADGGTPEDPPKWVRLALNQFADSQRAIASVSAALKIGDLWKRWMQDREDDGYSNSVYEANWAALGPYWADRDPTLIDKPDWRAYAKQRFALGRQPATVHTELSRLANCLKWARKNKLLKEDPIQWLPAGGKPRDRVLEPAEAAALLEAARHGDPHIRPFVVLLFATAGRHTAVLDLEWSRIHFDGGPIDLETGKPTGEIDLDVTLPPDPMNKSWRKGRALMAMSRMARAMLKEMHPHRGTSGFVIEHGGRRIKSAREGFRAACERAGLGWYEDKAEVRYQSQNAEGTLRFVTDVTPHTIRHTVATWTKGKVSTAFTAALLGHEDEATTRLIYQHDDAETTLPAVQIIEQRLTGVAALPEMERGSGTERESGAEKSSDVVKVTHDAAPRRRRDATDVIEED